MGLSVFTSGGWWNARTGSRTDPPRGERAPRASHIGCSYRERERERERRRERAGEREGGREGGRQGGREGEMEGGRGG